MLGTPLVAVHQNTPASGIGNASDVQMGFDTVDWDPHKLWNSGASTIVLPAGRYQAQGQCTMPGGTGGLIRAAYMIDFTSGSLAAIGGKVITGDAKPAYTGVVGAGYLLNFGRTFKLTAASTPLAFTVYQDSGGSMTLSSSFGGCAWAINRLP